MDHFFNSWCKFLVRNCSMNNSGLFFVKKRLWRVIEEYLENLDRFGFKRVVLFNDHGDGLHISAIVEAIKNANRKLELQAY